MGRHPTNKFAQVLIGGTNKIFKKFTVKLPFPVTVEYRSLSQKRNKNYGTVIQLIRRPYSEKEQIIKDFKNSGYCVVKVHQLSTYLTELCPQCDKKGIPKIEKKDTADNRLRTWRNKKSTKLAKRPDEYWLTYYHNTEHRKCRIKQYQGREFNTFKPNKRKAIPFRKLTIENTIDVLKNQ